MLAARSPYLREQILWVVALLPLDRKSLNRVNQFVYYKISIINYCIAYVLGLLEPLLASKPKMRRTHHRRCRSPNDRCSCWNCQTPSPRRSRWYSPTFTRIALTVSKCSLLNCCNVPANNTITFLYRYIQSTNDTATASSFWWWTSISWPCSFWCAASNECVCSTWSIRSAKRMCSMRCFMRTNWSEFWLKHPEHYFQILLLVILFIAHTHTHKHSLSLIKEMCLSFIVKPENMYEIVMSEEFLAIDKPQMVDIIRRRFGPIKLEVKIDKIEGEQNIYKYLEDFSNCDLLTCHRNHSRKRSGRVLKDRRPTFLWYKSRARRRNRSGSFVDYAGAKYLLSSDVSVV